MKTFAQVVMGAFAGFILRFPLEALFWEYSGLWTDRRFSHDRLIPAWHLFVPTFVYGPLLCSLCGMLLGLYHKYLKLNRSTIYLVLGCPAGVVIGALAGGMVWSIRY